MQLQVEKSDGSLEVYLHTKVMGTITLALSEVGDYQETVAEQLAEAVSLYLRHQYGSGRVSFNEIRSMIEVVLADTGHEKAALALQEHRIIRQIKRNRVEVVKRSIPQRIFDSRRSVLNYDQSEVQPWNKSMIVRELERERHLPRGLARVIAGVVEEKVLTLGYRQIDSTLIRALVDNEFLAMRQAERALAERKPVKEVEEESPVAAVC
jgi:hypothetical protein